MRRPEHVVIIGAGITGLAVAHALEKMATPRVITVLERSSRLGGNIFTVRHNGFLIDSGPDSWVASKPHATALAKEIGLEAELIETSEGSRRVYIAHEGQLHPMPEGVMMGIPTEVMPIVTSDLFTWDAKLRMGLELLVPPASWRENEDETVASFLGRRFGEQLTERLAGPLLGGIFAAEAEQISVRAGFPQLVEAEKKYGSLIVAMRAAKAARSGAKAGSMFLSLKRGMDDFVVYLAHRLRCQVALRVEITEITELPPRDSGGRFRVHCSSGPDILADHVVFTGPAHAASAVLCPVDERFASTLSDFDYSSSATVFVGYKRTSIDHPLDASGFIVPRSSGLAILASTWVSSKWEHRAPTGHTLLRAFFGGAGREEILDRDDDSLVDLAVRELGIFLKLSRKPVFSRVFRYHKVSPRPKVGHVGRMASLRKLLGAHPGLYITGNGYDGIGIPECIRQAQDVARAIDAAPPS